MIDIITHIKYLVKADKLPNAFLIIDENDTYGYKLTKSIAFWLLCNEKINSNMCKKCISCLFFLKGKHPDYHELYSNNEIIKLENLKKFLAHLCYKPAISKNKVMLLYPVNLFSDKASNAILKILEEPPDNAFFLLISHKQHIASTIKDRCQVFSIQSKTKLKSSNVMRFLYNYLIFDKNENLSSFIDQTKKNDEEFILDSIYIFIMHYLKNISMKKKTFYNKNVDKTKLFNILRIITQTKRLTASHLNPKYKYSIETILKTVKNLVFFSIKNN